MQIKISVRHGTLGEEAQEKVRVKFEKLARLFDRLTEITVEIDLEHRDKPLVDVIVAAEHKHDFKAAHQADELMAAVDQVMHKLEQQLRKYKQRIQDHHRSSGARQSEVPGDLGPATTG